MQDLDILIQQEADHPSDAYLVSSMRLLLDGFLGDEEVFRSFGHTFLHEQQHISFDHWKKFQASQAVKDIMLLDHGFYEAEFDRVPGPYDEENIRETEHDENPTLSKSTKVVCNIKTDLYHGRCRTETERAAAHPQFSSKLGNSGEFGSTSALANSAVTSTVEAPTTPEEVEFTNFITTSIDIEDQNPVVTSPSPKKSPGQLPEPTTTRFCTFFPCQPEIQPTSYVQLDVSHEALQEPSSKHILWVRVKEAEDRWVHDVLSLVHLRGCNQMFSVLLSSIQRAAKLGRGDVLSLLLEPNHFDPRMDLTTAAAQMEVALQSTIEDDLKETGGILIEYYLRHELYKWGNIDWVVLEAAIHRRHWILASCMHRATGNPMELAYQAAKHAAGGPLQPILQVLSSIEPDVFRLCIDHAARAADTRSVRTLLSAAQESKGLRHASIIWEASMTGDAQVLWSVFGPGARKTVLILLQEAGNIRVRQVHEIFTRRYPSLLMQLHKASCHFAINIEELIWSREYQKRINSLSAWDRGIRALKYLVQGNVPDNFPDVMLVLSIAKAVSTTLYSTYTPSGSWSHAFLRDLPRWQILLPSSQHAAYSYCVRRLWGVNLDKCVSPEPLSDPDLLDRFQGLAICLLRGTTDILRLNDNASGNSLHSSQRRRACHDLVDPASQESPPRSSPKHGASTRYLGQWDYKMGHGFDPGPNEWSPDRPRTWQAITERLQYPIPPSKIPSIFIMMGAIFFCLLQFTFCKFLPMACMAFSPFPFSFFFSDRSLTQFSVLRLCRTTLPDLIHTSASACASTFGFNLLFEPLETLIDKCEFLEVYFGLRHLASADGLLLKPWLSLSIYASALSMGQDASRNGFHVDEFDNHAPRRGLETQRSGSTIDGSPPDDEAGSTPFSRFSTRTNSEAGSVAKSGYFCTTCNTPFPTSSNFHRHMREKHKKARFSCDKCGKDFSRADYVRKHRCRGKTSRARARAVKPKMI